VTLALAGLGKETSLLSAAALDFDWRRPRTWGRTLVVVALVAVPLLAWMTYVRVKFGPADDPGFGNFTLPLAGYAEKVQAAWREAMSRDAVAVNWATLATVFALTVQWLFFVVRWRPTERWWRVGMAFAVMMAFLSTPVWEGYPGAATRVLLPMTLAFNVLLPRGARWLPVLIAGNLTIAASIFEFSPPHEFYDLRGETTLRAAFHVVPARGWHGPERHLAQRWRWSSGRSELKLVNTLAVPVRVTLRALASSANEPRSLRVSVGEKLLWGDTISGTPVTMRFGLAVPPGETTLVFSTDRPAEKIGTDPRALAYRIGNLDIVVTSASVSR
jgi:hypothetical protein